MGRSGGAGALRRRRLQVELRAFEDELERRTKVVGGSPGSLKEYVNKSLEAAKKSAETGNDHSAWIHLHRARRFLLESFNKNERLMRAMALQREAEEKLTNWRGKAVRDVLLLDPNKPRAPSTGALILAQFLLDEHFANVYFKLELLGARVRLLAWLLVGTTLLLVVGAFSARVFEILESDYLFSSPAQLLFVLLLGALGAVLSMTLSLTQLAGRVPEVLQGWTEATVRPLVGALSAVVLVAILQAQLIIPIAELTVIQLSVFAILAGFSDQVVVRVMGRAEKALTE